MGKTIDHTKVGDTFTVQRGRGTESRIETFKVTNVHKHFVETMNLTAGGRESFCLGDLVIFGLEPSLSKGVSING